MAKKNGTEENDVSFEKSYTRLEEILNTFEQDIESISLEKMIDYYKEGLNLINTCRQKLTDAELEIKKIQAQNKLNVNGE